MNKIRSAIVGAVLMGLGGTAWAAVWTFDIGLDTHSDAVPPGFYRAAGQFDEEAGAIVSYDIVSDIGNQGPVRIASDPALCAADCEAHFITTTHLSFSITYGECHDCFAWFQLVLDGPLTGDSVGILPASNFEHALMGGSPLPGSRLYDTPLAVPEPGTLAWMLLAIPFLWIFWKRQVFAAGRP